MCMTQSQETADNTYSLQENNQKQTETVQLVQQTADKSPSSLQQTVPNKTIKYKKFKALVKNGGYTSARVTAQALGVDHRTILSWLKNREVQEALTADLNSYVAAIKESKDWKAKAYLLDKATQHDKEDTSGDLKQLIVINLNK